MSPAGNSNSYLPVTTLYLATIACGNAAARLADLDRQKALFSRVLGDKVYFLKRQTYLAAPIRQTVLIGITVSRAIHIRFGQYNESGGG